MNLIDELKLYSLISHINRINVKKDYLYKPTDITRRRLLSFILRKHSDICYITPEHHIIVDCDNKTIKYSGISIDILNAKKQNKRFVMLYIVIYSHGNSHGNSQNISSHAGILIYDMHMNTLERFEPLGQKSPYDCDDTINEAINAILSDKLIFESIVPRYIGPNEICICTSPHFALLQSNPGQKSLELSNYCMIWSLFYLDLRLTFPDIVQSDLINILINHIRINTIINYSYISLLNDNAFNDLVVDTAVRRRNRNAFSKKSFISRKKNKNNFF